MKKVYKILMAYILSGIVYLGLFISLIVPKVTLSKEEILLGYGYILMPFLYPIQGTLTILNSQIYPQIESLTILIITLGLFFGYIIYELRRK